MARFVVVALVVGLLVGMLGDNATAAAAGSESSKPVAYIIAKSVYRHVDNDTFSDIYHDVESKRSGWPGDILQRAADDVCTNRGGELMEDFSCNKRKFSI